jgi:hypothetical protein
MGHERTVEITRETLRSTIASIGGAEMSDQELQDVLPIVLRHRELLLGIRHLRLDDQMGAPRRPDEE